MIDLLALFDDRALAAAVLAAEPGLNIGHLLAADRDAAYEVSKTLREVDYREPLKRFENPVMIAHGILDTRRGKDSVLMMQESLRQAEVAYLQTGHTPMSEDPAGYQEALDHLLGQIPGFEGHIK